jgi:peptide/nickel transport system substrate-binding protein
MTDVRLRRAVLHAVDRQALVDVLMMGQSSVAHAFLNPQEPEYSEVESAIARYDYDPRQAARLIEQLGYVSGPDGIAIRRDGQPLAFQFQSTVLAVHQSSLLSIADYLKRVGIGSELETLAPQRVDDREYRSTRSGFELSRTPNSLSSFLSRNHGSQTPLPEDNFRRYTNKSRYQNPEFDALIDAYFATIPVGERNQVLRQIIAHTTENLNIMPIFYDVEPTPMTKRVLGFREKKGELSSSAWNAHEWDLK